MYADDTTYFCNIDNSVTEDVINRELYKIYKWLGANKLALNVSKTKFMVFHTHKKKTVKYQKKRHTKSKWISNRILKSIYTKDRLYKVLVQTDPANTILYERRKEEFKQYRAELRKSIRKAKRDYYTSIFNRHENDIRKM